MNATLEAKLKSIPPGPGVYLYKDSTNLTVYVGKAKSLRNRVRTYFQLSRDLDERKDQMMDAIEDVEFIMTDTEGEALALENNLIKRLTAKMQEASSNEQFELAAHYRDAIETMETLAERQKMAVLGYDDLDIFGYHQEDNMVAVSIFHMRGGRIVDKRELFWEDQDSFEPGEFFQSVLKQYYVDAPFIPVEIHVPVDFE